jgi:hypothetical protein
MNRTLSFTGGLTMAVALLGWDLALAQQAPPPATPPMKSVLAGKKLIPPAQGEVPIEFTTPVSTRTKDSIKTTIMVKNVGTAPIARLTVNETWFSDAGAVVSGNRGFIDGLLQPGEVKPLVVETPFKDGMSRSSMKFTHANGAIKEKKVPKLVATPPAK